MVSMFGERVEQERKVGGTVKNGRLALQQEGQLTAVSQWEGGGEGGGEDGENERGGGGGGKIIRA